MTQPRVPQSAVHATNDAKVTFFHAGTTPGTSFPLRPEATANPLPGANEAVTFQPRMHPWQSFLLGLIEGITEFLPISSTGHLIVAQRLMGIGTISPAEKEAADAFAICIQGGAILAVLGLYWGHVKQMIAGVFGKDSQGLRLLINLIAGFLPAAVIGVLANDWIEEKLFGLWPVVTAWVVGGIAILAVSFWRKKNPVAGGGRELSSLTWQLALAIGLLQCVAMWPGTSRSLMTIVGGLMVGLSVRAAVEYSFLLGVVTLTAATAKKAVWKMHHSGPEFEQWLGGAKLMWKQFGGLNLAIGVIAAMVFAALAVKWLVGYLQRHGLAVFGWYRIAIGALIGGLVAAGVLSA
jgi:undecaprenyl-diphosphatase